MSDKAVFSGTTEKETADSNMVTMPSFDLSGKTAIITGGTKGLGFGVAATYANYGANVVITARTAADIKTATGSINSQYITGQNKCIGFPADSAKKADIEKVI